ncbi:MAG: CHAP domain-containing protein [Bacteroidota bacterium]
MGDPVDSFNGITVYNNGLEYDKSHGRHYSADSFYYGKKWQCVEYIKRYYHDRMEHKFPDGSGHAKEFFDASLPQGGMNERRGLVQYRNGDKEKPQVNDILVFGGKYGHVAIVSRVGEDEIEVVQQNIYLTPRETFALRNENGRFFVGEGREPLGWLRKE